jgi:hypothetical protein
MKAINKKMTIPGIGKLLEHKSRALLDANKITLKEYLEKSKESTIDKMKPLQLLYNLQAAGIKIENIPAPNMVVYKEWATKILDENKELFDEQMREEFLNFVVYEQSKM